MKNDIKQCVRFVGSNFSYLKDLYRLFDYWKVMKYENGTFYGDCEDFSLTVFWLHSGKNIFTFLFRLLITHQYKLYFVKTKDGVGHAVGRYKDFWFDNFTKDCYMRSEFFAKTEHKIKFMHFTPTMIIPLILGLFTRNTQ